MLSYTTQMATADDLPVLEPCLYGDECRRIHEDQQGELSISAQRLACYTSPERDQLCRTYRATFGLDLTAELLRRARAAGQDNRQLLLEALHLWLLRPPERDAALARDAVERGSESGYGALVEIYAGRKPGHLVSVAHAYRARYGRSLDSDIAAADAPSSHPSQKILAALAATQRSHRAEPSRDTAKCDAKRLHEAAAAVSGGGGVDEAAVVEVISKRSIPQLKLTFSCYRHIYGRNYTKVVNGDGSGDFERSLRAAIGCVCDPPKYFAKVLRRSLDVAGDGSALARVVVGRAEVDMEEIGREFVKRYGTELSQAIESSVPSGGGYRDFLVSLVTNSS